MLKRSCAFVVGAGASAEFGLPVGTALQDRIADLVDIKFDEWGNQQVKGDHQLYQIVRGGDATEGNEYLRAGWLIRQGIPLSRSIDSFMDKHHENHRLVRLGRLGIAKALIQSERSSALFVRDYPRDRLSLGQLKETWIGRLFTLMQDGVRRKDVKKLFDNSAFIIFNYDRCLEHFFVQAISLTFGISEPQAIEIVKNAAIFHPYGTIGRLPGFESGDEPVVAFGEGQYPLAEMSNCIRTYTDRIEDESSLAPMRNVVAQSELICFLGFSYQPQNLSLIAPPGKQSGKSLVGTALGFSDYDTGQISRGLRPVFGSREQDTYLDNRETCAGLLTKYSRAFA